MPRRRFAVRESPQALQWLRQLRSNEADPASYYSYLDPLAQLRQQFGPGVEELLNPQGSPLLYGALSQGIEAESGARQRAALTGLGARGATPGGYGYAALASQLGSASDRARALAEARRASIERNQGFLGSLAQAHQGVLAQRGAAKTAFEYGRALQGQQEAEARKAQREANRRAKWGAIGSLGGAAINFLTGGAGGGAGGGGGGALAHGGIVRRPTMAMIGEAGPEAVVPLTPGMMPRPLANRLAPRLDLALGTAGRGPLPGGFGAALGRRPLPGTFDEGFGIAGGPRQRVPALARLFQSRIGSQFGVAPQGPARPMPLRYAQRGLLVDPDEQYGEDTSDLFETGYPLGAERPLGEQPETLQPESLEPEIMSYLESLRTPEPEPQGRLERILAALGTSTAAQPFPGGGSSGESFLAGLLNTVGRPAAVRQAERGEREKERRTEARALGRILVTEHLRARRQPVGEKIDITPALGEKFPDLKQFVGTSMSPKLVGLYTKGYQSPAALAAQDRATATALRAAAAAERQNRLASATTLNQLADDYQKDADITAYRTARQNLNTIRAAGKLGSGPGDLAMLISYVRATEPGVLSVVRQEELKNVQSAVGALRRLMVIPDQWISGQRLTPAGRREIQQAAQEIAGSRKADYDLARNQYRRRTEALGEDPSLVLRDYEERPPLQTFDRPVRRTRMR